MRKYRKDGFIMAIIMVKRAGEDMIEELDIPASKGFERMREIIDGYIECVHIIDPAYSLTMYVDEDGINKELPLNFKIKTNNPFYPVQDILGTVCFARGRIIDDEIEYTDLTEEDKLIIMNLIERGLRL